MSPASLVFEKFSKAADGKSVPRYIASITGIDPSEVYRWVKPKERGGTGGLVPAHWQRAVLDAAKKAGVKLKPEDLVG